MATKRLELPGHLGAEELKERMRHCKEPQQARRWQALWHLRQGESTKEVAEACGFSARWVQNRGSQGKPRLNTMLRRSSFTRLTGW